ncbi:MAG: 1-acyl-sn-glycerol-3-phosphate acyltransferase [Actinobacteria bacterium]|nr:1-acyl-sn-glycerol-3-phosphate acyltransferase [Actinomycetota bacterium]
MARNLLKKISDFFYSIPVILFINFYKLFTRTRVFNTKRLAGRKSVILAINHTADADPIILLAAIKKKICFIAESENFGNWLTSFFMRKFANCVPVFKKQLEKNAKSFKELFYILNKKNVFFGIFPEGELNKKNGFKKFKNGAAYLSYKTKLPIIPIYIHNTNRGSDSKRWILTNRITRGIISLIINTFRKINIFIGEPINPTAENIIEDFKDFADPGTYKKIINNINEALKEEFLELASEADDLFGTGEEDTSGTSLVDDDLIDNGLVDDLTENPRS